MNNTEIARLPMDDTKAQCREALAALVRRYNETFHGVSKAKVSEETIRAWINDFLAVFGWDVRNIKQVWQEAVLDERNRRRLSDINSTHKRPDYTLLNGGQIKAFLDAKSLAVDIFTSQATAFQIRSYGWSAQVPCSFVSNFEQTVIYDTRYENPRWELRDDLGFNGGEWRAYPARHCRKCKTWQLTCSLVLFAEFQTEGFSEGL